MLRLLYSSEEKGGARPRSFSFAGGDLGVLLRDNSFNTAPGQRPSVNAAGVGPISQHRVWAGARPATTTAGNADVTEDFGEHRAVVALAHGDDQPVPIGGRGCLQRRGSWSSVRRGSADAVTARR